MEKRKEKFLKNKSGNEKLCFYQAVYKQVGRMGRVILCLLSWKTKSIILDSEGRVFLINQPISVFSQTQFLEIVSSQIVVKSSFGKFFPDECNNLP